MRIAGILSPKGRAALERGAAALGAGLRPLPGWTGRTLIEEGAALGRWGEGAGFAASARGTAVVMDGRVFNRADLGGGSDAETVLSLYERHGFAGALQRLNGDFAVALYDAGRRTLWLGRDRFGVKPLYYAQHGGEFAFASRPRPLFFLGGAALRPNPTYVSLFAACHYRTFDNDSAASPFAGIHQLRAGHWLKVSDGVVETQPYWTLEEAPDWTDGEEVLAERYRALLLDAVGLRVKAAKSAAFTLSGGMDSSSVLASAVHLTGEKQQAYSSVYTDKTFDESAEIRPMLASTVAKWNAVEIGTPDLPREVALMVEAHDEPVATATWLSHFILCRAAAAQGVRSLFGGLGGDELNAGEYEYFWYHFADLRAAGREDVLRHEVEWWAKYHDHPIYRKGFDALEAGLARLADPARPGFCRADRTRLERYANVLAPGRVDLRAFAPVMDHPFRSALKNRAYQDIFRETIPCCLRAEDRQAAAHGIENFLPFFDHRLVEFMFRVPGGLKIRDGVTKHLLRRAMTGILPEETRTRVKKVGWNAPAHVWFSGKGAEWLMDIVRSRAFRERGVYDAARVEAILREHQEIVADGRPVENHMMFLWQLLNLELWFRHLDALSAAQAGAGAAR